MHKTGNVLSYLPKSGQARAKQGLHEIRRAETRAKTERAFDQWLACYHDKYPKATACLARDRDELLTFYDFPAAHWAHLRTTNVIESAFATIRHRSSRAKGCVTRYCFLPLYAFCGRQLLAAYLRPSNIDAARHTWAILSLLVKGLRQAWPGVRTELLQ